MNRLANLIISVESIETEARSKPLKEVVDDIMMEKLGYEELVSELARCRSLCDLLEFENEQLGKYADGLEELLTLQAQAYSDTTANHEFLTQISKLEALYLAKKSFLEGATVGREAQRKLMGNHGAAGKKNLYKPLIARVIELVLSKTPRYKSRRNAALSIKPEILGLAKQLSIPLSEQQAEATIGGWIKKQIELGTLPPFQSPKIK